MESSLSNQKIYSKMNHTRKSIIEHNWPEGALRRVMKLHVSISRINNLALFCHSKIGFRTNDRKLTEFQISNFHYPEKEKEFLILEVRHEG